MFLCSTVKTCAFTILGICSAFGRGGFWGFFVVVFFFFLLSVSLDCSVRGLPGVGVVSGTWATLRANDCYNC